MKKILVIGGTGFIGFHVCMQLLTKGQNVIGVDCITDYYDIKLKNNRLKQLTAHENYTHLHNRIESLDTGSLSLSSDRVIIVHLAAQVSVIKSLENPKETHNLNATAFLEIIELSKGTKVSKIVYPSTFAISALTVKGVRLLSGLALTYSRQD